MKERKRKKNQDPEDSNLRPLDDEWLRSEVCAKTANYPNETGESLVEHADWILFQADYLLDDELTTLPQFVPWQFAPLTTRPLGFLQTEPNPT